MFAIRDEKKSLFEHSASLVHLAVTSIQELRKRIDILQAVDGIETFEY